MLEGKIIYPWYIIPPEPWFQPYFQCTNARTYRECREKGEVEYCTKEQNSCFIETVKEKVPRYAFPDYDVHKGREGTDFEYFIIFRLIFRKNYQKGKF